MSVSGLENLIRDVASTINRGNMSNVKRELRAKFNVGLEEDTFVLSNMLPLSVYPITV